MSREYKHVEGLATLAQRESYLLKKTFVKLSFLACSLNRTDFSSLFEFKGMHMITW